MNMTSDVKRLDIHLFKVGLFSGWQHSLMHQKTDVPQQPEGDMVMRVLEWLHRQSYDKELRGVNLVATYFPDGPSVPGEKLDIILATPEGMIIFFVLFLSALTLWQLGSSSKHSVIPKTTTSRRSRRVH